MKILSGPGAASAWCARLRRAGSRIVLVPTMGALHEGHAALIRRARKAAGPEGIVVLSLFVNPIQFDREEDFAKYPRTAGEDRRFCRREGVDLLFEPRARELYSDDRSVLVSESSLSTGLCGSSRPGHFDGVCTVVSMLFHLLGPDAAVFGEKDWQQLAVVRRMVRDLHMPVRIQGVPTVREPDGLAMSSRNRRLSAGARASAPSIFAALRATAAASRGGERSVARLRSLLRRSLDTIPGAETDYAEIVCASTLHPLRALVPETPARAVVAVGFGPVRLIDNIALPCP